VREVEQNVGLSHPYQTSGPRSAMEQERRLQQRAPPPAYTQHEPESLHLPSVPTHTPGYALHHGYSPRSQSDASQRGILPAPNSATLSRAPDARDEVGSPMDTSSVRSVQDDGASRREMSVSRDDPDVRLAAEALSELGNSGTFAITLRWERPSY
jgi:hypothetical protein